MGDGDGDEKNESNENMEEEKKEEETAAHAAQWGGGWAPLTGPTAQEPLKPKRDDPDYFSISKEPQNSGFLITYGIVQPNKMIIRVTITSTLLRNDVTEKKSAEAEEE